MSLSTNIYKNFCDVCDLSFETKKGLYRHQSYDSKHEELLEKMFSSDDEAPIDVKPKAERFIPHHPIPYMKTWRECLTQKKNITSSDLSPKLRVSLKGLRHWFPKLKLNPNLILENGSLIES